MTEPLIAEAMALAALLTRENAALTALDFAGAAALLPQKETVTAAFAAAQRDAGDRPDGATEDMRRLAGQLRDLADENRRLLERAIYVQRRVVGAVVRAVPKAFGGAARYGATGAMAAIRRPPPVVVSARV